jgi:hypothetical protein
MKERTDRIHDHTSARGAIRPFVVSNIEPDIFELILERSRICANSLAVKHDSHDLTKKPDTRGYTITPTEERV